VSARNTVPALLSHSQSESCGRGCFFPPTRTGELQPHKSAFSPNTAEVQHAPMSESALEPPVFRRDQNLPTTGAIWGLSMQVWTTARTAAH
jgi:hypothetical protein